MKIKKSKKYFTALFLLFFAASSLNGMAEPIDGGYRIRIQIKGIPDSVCYLANYFGDKTYLVDTALVKKDGSFVFESDTLLPGGIYIVAGQSNNKYFELLVDESQRFSVNTSLTGIPGELRFENSPDNALFYYYVNENIQRRKKVEEITRKLKGMDSSSDSALILNEKVKSIYDGLYDFEDSIINSYPESFVSVVLKAKQEPELAPARYLEDGREDSVYAYQSYKRHFWDNLDPADERLLRTPLYHKRLKSYFENVIFQDPDTLTREADFFIQRARSNKETFKYAVWYLTYKFETSNIMGFDEVFVHMVDNYYARGEAYWTDSTIVRSLMKRADELRNVLIGSQAPNLILIDTAGAFKSLYSYESEYMIVLFYEYGCGHCRKEITALKSWDPVSLYDAQVFAVNTDTNLREWKKFITEQKLDWIHVNATRSITQDYHDLYDINVTPTIYLLDNRKKIIAKRLKTEQMIPFLENYHKQHGN